MYKASCLKTEKSGRKWDTAVILPTEVVKGELHLTLSKLLKEQLMVFNDGLHIKSSLHHTVHFLTL